MYNIFLITLVIHLHVTIQSLILPHILNAIHQYDNKMHVDIVNAHDRI